MIPTPVQMDDFNLIKQVIASRSYLAWIKPSYIMAECQIESGFDPIVVNGTGRQDGLMQVVPGTVTEVERAYALSLTLPQTDPFTSLLTGTLYFDLCARQIIAARHATSLYLVEVAEAYNVGYRGFLAGLRNLRYGLKMLAAQTRWSYLDNLLGTPLSEPSLLGGGLPRSALAEAVAAPSSED